MAEDNLEEISVIIPTYNRVEDLESCLKSIVVQTRKPKEVLIVDDSEGDKTRLQVEAKGEEFGEEGIALRYLRNTRGRSLAVARNEGINNAQGEIILFLDDDVILNEDYVENLSDIYTSVPGCNGVQGHILLKDKLNGFYNLMSRSIFYNYVEKNSCRVLPSTCITYPHPLETTIKCEWLAGSNQSYRRSVLKEFNFDENFRRYSWREDVDLSYRIGKRYPGSLYITPHAKLVHNISDKARMPDKALIYMKEVYSFYFFFKNIDQNPKNKMIFMWSKLGFLLQVSSIFLFRPDKDTQSKLRRLRYLLGAYAVCIRYLKEIKQGDVEFFNRKIESSNT
ncbi:MAG: glycosyltransferase family 2 protein [Methanotrichaceae archaeon]|nr:glycosyltransferase family 2 protein [Methanotrichaceae archaeon]